MWRRGVVVITTARLHSTNPELRFCAGSYPGRGVSEIRDGEDLWQCSRLKIRLNTFRLSTIPQKQFTIITIQPFNLRFESKIQEFLILDLEKSRTFFNLFYLPNDSDSFVIQFHWFFSCANALTFTLKFPEANLKSTSDLSIPVYGFLLKRLVVLA